MARQDFIRKTKFTRKNSSVHLEYDNLPVETDTNEVNIRWPYVSTSFLARCQRIKNFSAEVTLTRWRLCLLFCLAVRALRLPLASSPKTKCIYEVIPFVKRENPESDRIKRSCVKLSGCARATSSEGVWKCLLELNKLLQERLRALLYAKASRSLRDPILCPILIAGVIAIRQALTANCP